MALVEPGASDPKSVRAYRLAFVLVVFIALGLSWIAYSEGLAILEVWQGLDKVFHFTLAGALAFCLDGALGRCNLHVGRVRLPLASVLVLVPCAIDEWMQRWSSTRTSSIWDFLADVAGVTIWLGIARRIHDDSA
ncbi:MAG: VanZ family protein [Polyangiaceae bacterium]|nr:VanZ family protein [Polyangiaceae bacterium]